MFKPVAFAVGQLLTSISPTTTTLVVSLNLYNQLATVLGSLGVDWTYLFIGDESYGEIVRVDSVSGGVVAVTRGMDGSTPRAFVSNIAVAYKFCSAAVADMLAAATSVVITTTAPLHATLVSPGHYNLTIDPLQITSNNGSLTVGGGTNSYDLYVNPSAFGLCATGISG